MRNILVYTIIAVLFGCSKDTNQAPTFSIGKNKFNIKIDGDNREYYVHVPRGYDGSKQFPVVFMLHGSSGSGEKFYNISGWKEVGDTANIITVYPSSWEYCIIDEGKVKRTTKWNALGSFGYCIDEVPRNDEKFLNAILDEIAIKYVIDSKRIYLVGFSNGGAMAAQCLVTMSDRFTAISSNAGSLRPDTFLVPKRIIPCLLQVGNIDENLIGLNDNISLPMNFNKIFEIPDIKGAINSYKYALDLENNFTPSGDQNSVITATYKGKSNKPNNVFLYRVIKDLAHQYPNGKNHPYNAAQEQWNWFKQFSF